MKWNIDIIAQKISKRIYSKTFVVTLNLNWYSKNRFIKEKDAMNTLPQILVIHKKRKPQDFNSLFVSQITSKLNALSTRQTNSFEIICIITHWNRAWKILCSKAYIHFHIAPCFGTRQGALIMEEHEITLSMDK